MKNFQSRAEVPEQYKWDLTKVFATDEDFLKACRQFQEDVKALDAYKGRLGESAKVLYEFMVLSDDLNRKGENIHSYGSHRSDEDAKDEKLQELEQIVQQMYVVHMQASAFAKPELMSIGREKIEEFIKEEEGLKFYAQALDDQLRREKHTLSTKEELLLSAYGEVFRGPENSFRALNDADLEFPEIIDEDGKKQRLTHANASIFLKSPNREVRRAAYEARNGTFKKFNNTFASNLVTKVKSNVISARIRNFESARHQALFDDNVPVRIYDTLIDRVGERLQLSARAMEQRKKILGLEKLERYDFGVPLAKEVKYEIPYEEAKLMVLEALKPLGEDYVNTVKKAFDDRWIDVYETPGKRSGAYSGGSYDSNPNILLNYQDELDDVFTLAHEMGHSMHSYYTNMQPYTYAHYPIFSAEIASTFNECLLNHYLIQNEKDDEKRLFLLDNFLATIEGTLFRQTQFAEFERDIHDVIEKGGMLTPTVLNAMYRESNNKYYPGSNFDELADVEWSRIPHFYYDFYVFQYATGISAALSLSKRVLAGEPGAIEKYYGFLKAGATDYAVNVLKEAGVDMEEGSVISEALDVYESYLDMVDEIINK